ncbi:unnamed protein product [Ilex paraguariensis]|uniref:Uncharacterized protein n=1 Tax=Ilex paraguariensis TaxID=185542 RepID=A0ABC8SG57_9AQUA
MGVSSSLVVHVIWPASNLEPSSRSLESCSSFFPGDAVVFGEQNVYRIVYSINQAHIKAGILQSRQDVPLSKLIAIYLLK